MFSHVYASWEPIQREKYNQIFKQLDPETMQILKGAHILDIGAGNGFLEQFLMEQGFDPSRIVALEPHPQGMLTSWPQCIQGRVEEAPVTFEKFDAVFIIDTVHLLDHTDFIADLKPGCIIIAGIFYTDENYPERLAMLEKALERCKILQLIQAPGKEHEVCIIARRT